jgi:regulatory protein
MAENYRSTASRPARRADAPTARGGREAHQTTGPSSPVDRAKQTAYRLLSYRDRSIKEIETKLTEKGYPEETIAEVIASLKEANYLDDDRFARQWVRLRTEHHHFGPIRLKRELLEKGIPSEEADRAIEGRSEEWDLVEQAEAALRRRFKNSTSLHDMKARQKAYAFLQRKGFNTETIFKAFKKIGTPE